MRMEGGRTVSNRNTHDCHSPDGVSLCNLTMFIPSDHSDQTSACPPPDQLIQLAWYISTTSQFEPLLK
ncbi:hypothetical protein ABKN59_008469 [Abortiporus biennis]